MRLSSFAFFLLASLALPFAIEEPLLPSVGTVEAIQLSSFSVSPKEVYVGQDLLFSLQLDSYSNSVTAYSATITIHSPAGQAAKIEVENASIAGGERQSVSRIWKVSPLAPGEYRATLEVSYSGNQSVKKSDSFMVLSSGQTTSAPPGSASGEIPKTAPDTTSSCPEIICGEWSDCTDNYRSRDCEHAALCKPLSFVQVESCAPKPVIEVAPLACSLPFACVRENQQHFALAACLPPFAAAAIFLLYLHLRNRR